MTVLARLAALAFILLLCAVLPAAAAATETVVLHTSFSPERLGASTTIGFGFDIANTSGGSPAPLQSVSLRLPAGIDYLTTTLGLAICQPAVLLAKGPAGCPPNSRLGFGSAFVAVPFGATSGEELPNIYALMGPPHNGNIVVLFYADGREPVSAQLVFQGELITGSRTLGGSLDTAVPLIPSVPEGAPVSIIRVRATIGPAGLTYYERVHGRTVSFHPTGVSLPSRCPHGGFPFSAQFAFQDATSAVAKSTVPCPHAR